MDHFFMTRITPQSRISRRVLGALTRFICLSGLGFLVIGAGTIYVARGQIRPTSRLEAYKAMQSEVILLGDSESAAVFAKRYQALVDKDRKPTIYNSRLAAILDSLTNDSPQSEIAV